MHDQVTSLQASDFFLNTKCAEKGYKAPARGSEKSFHCMGTCSAEAQLKPEELLALAVWIQYPHAFLGKAAYKKSSSLYMLGACTTTYHITYCPFNLNI